MRQARKVYEVFSDDTTMEDLVIGLIWDIPDDRNASRIEATVRDGDWIDPMPAVFFVQDYGSWLGAYRAAKGFILNRARAPQNTP